MDFEETLRRWEKLQQQEAASRKKEKGLGKLANAKSLGEDSAGKTVMPILVDQKRSLESWIALHGVTDKDAEGESEGKGDKRSRIEEAARLRHAKPQASLDLHGRTATEAQVLLLEFLGSSSRAGLDKVLVIHGKGIHSDSGPILSDLVRVVLEESGLAGSFGPADKENGGRGATWVLIRKKAYFSR